jgi:hypothetical protein
MRSHNEPEEGEEFIPKPRTPRKRKRKKIDTRLSPSQRKETRWVTVIMPAESYVKLKEIATFRDVPLSRAVSDIIDPEFDKVYEESLLLMRIEERRQKEEEEREAARRNFPARRTSF